MKRTMERGDQVESAALMIALEQSLSQHFDRQCHITSLQRRPCVFRSSYELEELTLTLDGGESLALLFKNLSRGGLLEGARGVKPLFLYDPYREAETYRIFLNSANLETATCYGAVLDDRAERYWLFLEKVSGMELYQVGEFEHWLQAARWLAQLHAYGHRLPELRQHAKMAHLLHYNGDYYAQWLHRATGLILQKTQPKDDHAQRQVRWLLNCYRHVIPRLLALPATLIHGEFYASNILLQQSAAGVRICAVDWEMAAIGPGLMDLAALTSGSWSEDQRTTMANAYYAEVCTQREYLGDTNEFLAGLECCRLHVAIQWLGWSVLWSPPPNQTQDWLKIGLRAAEKLDF